MISPSPPLGELAPTPLGVEPCSCDEALALREQLATLRAHHDTDAETCREALDRVDELSAELERLRAELETVRSNAIDQELENDDAHAAELDHAETRLAAANALLEMMLESGLQPSLDARIRAHLAAEAEHAAGYRFEREFPALEHIIARGCEPRLRALESAWGEGGGDGRD